MSLPKVVRHYRNRRLYDGKKAADGFYQDILDRISALMAKMKMEHGKIFYVATLMRFPKNNAIHDPHRCISRFLSLFRKNLISTVRQKRPLIKINLNYIWKAECVFSDSNPHYHIIFALNAEAWSDPNKPYKENDPETPLIPFLQLVTECWNKVLRIEPYYSNSGLVESPGQNGINGTVLRRSDLDKEQKLFEWFSYNAKVYSTISHLKRFDCSQGLNYIKKENQND